MPPIQVLTVKIGSDITEALKGLDKLSAKAKRLGSSMKEIGTTLTTGVTLPIVALGAGAAKAAIDFESSFAGIRKTMNLTEAEFDQLSQANRDLAKEIPVSANELNRIGEMAGQLGIEGVDNVLKFEDTIAKLAVTTDLAAEDGALAFAQIANVMQLPQDQIDRLGATVVGLGNNFATTESRIVDFTARIAGAGKLAGLTTGDVAGISTAFASIGVEAEAGGSAVQKVLLNMVAAVEQGGDALDQFAATSEMSSEEFRRAFKEDAAGAFSAFVAGLGKQGDAAITTLEGLGLTDQRLTRAFLSMAGAGDLLSRAIAQGNTEFQANTALTAEAEKRFGTTASKLKLLGNQLLDVGITMGDALLPAIVQILDAAEPFINWLASAAEWFAHLDPAMQTFIVGAAGVLAALGPIIAIVGNVITVLGALGSAFALLSNPIGWVIGAAALLTAAWVAFGDDISRIAVKVYDAINEWLVEKFAAIVDGVKDKIDAVTGFFAGMYDAVVGHSFVPDMVDGISDAFDRLQPEMVVPTKSATDKVTTFFERMAERGRENQRAIREMTQEFEDAGGTLDKVYIPSARRAADETDDLGSTVVTAADIWDDFGNGVGRVAGSASDAVVDFALGAKHAIRDFVSDALRQLARLAANALLKTLFTGLTGGTGGFLSSFFGGFFAGGGLLPAGHFGVVGEKGPELVFAGPSGAKIQPMGGGGGGRSMASAPAPNPAAFADAVLSRVGPPPSYASPEVAANDAYWRRFVTTALTDAKRRGVI